MPICLCMPVNQHEQLTLGVGDLAQLCHCEEEEKWNRAWSGYDPGYALSDSV